MNGRQSSSRLRNAIIVAISLSVVNIAMAIGLGPIEVDSYLGQPLDATIKISGLSASAAERSTVKLASISDYQSRGIEKLPSHDKLQFNIVKSGNGYRINVRSNTGIREPFVNFLLTISSDGTNVTREYAVFLNPDPAQTAGITSSPAPEIEPQQIQISQPLVSPIKQTQPVAEKPSETIQVSQVGAEKPVNPVSVTLQPASATSEGWGGTQLEGAKPIALMPSTNNMDVSNQGSSSYSGSTYGPVKPGETLYSIAVKTRPSEAVSVNKMMRAIFRANRRAFSSNNMNSLMAGYSLTIPNLNAIAATPVAAPKPASTKPASNRTPAVKPTASEEARANQSSESSDAEMALNAAIEDNEVAVETMIDDVDESISDMDDTVDDITSVDETENEQTPIPAATAEIARANMDTDGLGEKYAPVAESGITTDLVEEVEEPRLNSQLELDTTDSLGLPEQVSVDDHTPDVTEQNLDASMNESSEIVEINEEQNSDEVVTTVVDEVETPVIDNQPAVDNEAVTESDANADNVQAQQSSQAMNTNASLQTKEKEAMFPIWMMGLFAALIALLGFLVFSFFKRRSKSEEEMSDEEIAEMLALLEEDENLKQSLNFDELTENPNAEDQFEDISDNYPPVDNLAGEHEFDDIKHLDDDFEQLAEEAANLGNIGELNKGDTDWSASIEEETNEDESFDFDFNSSSEPAVNEQTKPSETNRADPLAEDDAQSYDLDFAPFNDDSSVNVDKNEQTDLSPDEDDFFDIDLLEEPQTESVSNDKASSKFDLSDEIEEQFSPLETSTFNDEVVEAVEGSKSSETGIDKDELNETMEINLDLANAFIVTGNGEKAINWLNEVIEHGSEAQKAKAQEMLKKINQA